MKPERINIVPPELGGDPSPIEQPWSAATFISRTFLLAPSLHASFLTSVLSRARVLLNPPKVTCVVEAGSRESGANEAIGLPLSLRVEWGGTGPTSAVDPDFANWISGLHDHLVTSTEVVN